MSTPHWHHFCLRCGAQWTEPGAYPKGPEVCQDCAQAIADRVPMSELDLPS